MISYLETRTITADTTPHTKRPAPVIPPIANPIPPYSLSAATIAPITSGAPFPRAKNVTPASCSLILSFFEIYSKAGLKYPSAVDPKR